MSAVFTFVPSVFGAATDNMSSTSAGAQGGGATEDADLKALEALMEEFFSGATSNARKREIEALLDNFSLQKDAWRRCLDFVAATRSHYVCMFALNVLETVIRRHWVGLPGAEHAEIRDALSRFLGEHFRSAPPFIGNKLIKLLVDVARTDWPHFYPDFLSRALEATRAPDSMRLGLSTLLIASEELASPRDDLPTGRKEELRRLLVAQAPIMLDAVYTILHSVLDKQRKLRRGSSEGPGGGSGPSAPGAHTPPPSPQHQMQDPAGGDQHQTPQHSAASTSFFTTSPVQDGSLLRIVSHRLLGSQQLGPGGGEMVARLAPFDSDSEEVSALALRCLAHMFTWIPLSSSISPQLLEVIFQFAALGCVPVQNL